MLLHIIVSKYVKRNDLSKLKEILKGVSPQVIGFVAVKCRKIRDE